MVVLSGLGAVARHDVQHVVTQHEIEQVQDAIARVGHRLTLRHLAQDKPTSLCRSNLSITIGLSMRLMGMSDPKDKQKFFSELGLVGIDEQRLGEILKQIISDLSVTDSVHIANGLATRTKIDEAYLAKITSLSDASVFELSHGADLAANEVNNWRSEKTGKPITQLVLPTDLENAALVMLDIFDLNIMWSRPFQSTSPDTFWCFDDQTVTAQIMKDSGPGRVFNGIEFDLAIKDYASNKGKPLQFVIVVPKNSSTLSLVCKKLNPQFFRECIKNAQHVDNLELYVPKLEVDSKVTDLLDSLEQVGFPVRSSLGNITPDTVATTMIHHCKTHVDEQGTAVSSATFGKRFKGISNVSKSKIRADRPFAFFVTQGVTQLAQGVVLDKSGLFLKEQEQAILTKAALSGTERTELSFEEFLANHAEDKHFQEFLTLLPVSLTDQKPHRVEQQKTAKGTTCTVVQYSKTAELLIDGNNALRINQQAVEIQVGFGQYKQMAVHDSSTSFYLYEEQGVLHLITRTDNDPKFPIHHVISKQEVLHHGEKLLATRVVDPREKEYNDRVVLSSVNRVSVPLDEWKSMLESDDLRSFSQYVPKAIREGTPRVEVQTLPSGVKFQIMNSTRHDFQFDSERYLYFNGTPLSNLPFTPDNCNLWFWDEDGTIKFINRDIGDTIVPHGLELAITTEGFTPEKSELYTS